MALDPSEHTVDEIRNEVDRITDPGELRAALDAEREGKDRRTAKRAFRRRIEEIETRGTLLATAAEDASNASERLEMRMSGGRYEG